MDSAVQVIAVSVYERLMFTKGSCLITRSNERSSPNTKAQSAKPQKRTPHMNRSSPYMQRKVKSRTPARTKSKTKGRVVSRRLLSSSQGWAGRHARTHERTPAGPHARTLARWHARTLPTFFFSTHASRHAFNSKTRTFSSMALYICTRRKGGG